MIKKHRYATTVTWTGNKGAGTAGYLSYDRAYLVSVKGKADIAGSSDAAFLGDPSKYNPEDLLLASISSCHMLWYLHLCSENGIVVVDYRDEAVGTMEELADGSGRFTEATLHPQVLVADSRQLELAASLHKEAKELCFIANSLNFPVRHKPDCKAAGNQE